MRAAHQSRRWRECVESSSWLPGGIGAIIALLSLLASDAAAVRAAGNTQDPAKAVVTADARAKASDIFSERCAACHGTDGTGNGPAAANLKPRPIDFHSQNWQRSVSDDSIIKAIIFGGRSVGKSGQMAPNPDLENEPAIVAALVEKIRQWRK
jgi:mono/diheme cytochrome c family protein